MEEQEKTPQKLTQKQMRSAAKKRRRRGAFGTAVAVFIVFSALYLLFILLGSGILLYSFYSNPKNEDIFSLSVIYDEQVLHNMDSDEANNDYGLYIPFEYLSEIGNFGLAGEGDDVTLFIIGTDNRIKCTKNSSLVVINNNPIRISAPILYEEEDYLIPVSLLENYVNGIDVTYDTEKMVCKVSSDLSKADVSLKILLPEAMEAAYFPESYKYYDFEESQGSEEPDIIP
ncbi:MAG: hypothetical protein E7586_03020 [Ruminococcaceae bacterium]|nr:hypothetical protein [Oscillospiraceae bacterium]